MELIGACERIGIRLKLPYFKLPFFQFELALEFEVSGCHFPFVHNLCPHFFFCITFFHGLLCLERINISIFVPIDLLLPEFTIIWTIARLSEFYPVEAYSQILPHNV